MKQFTVSKFLLAAGLLCGAAVIMACSTVGEVATYPDTTLLHTIDDSEAYHDLVICPFCKEKGLKSKVYIGACMSTLMYCGNGHYDEDGRFHPPKDCNTTTCGYSCSNGHEWSGKY